MSRSAITLPKYLLTLRTSRRGTPFLDGLIRRPSSARARGAPSDEGVDTDGDEKDHAQKRVVPVGVPVGESGLGQHVGCDYGDGDPPEHRILEVVGGEERAAED